MFNFSIHFNAFQSCIWMGNEWDVLTRNGSRIRLHSPKFNNRSDTQLETKRAMNSQNSDGGMRACIVFNGTVSAQQQHERTQAQSSCVAGCTAALMVQPTMQNHTYKSVSLYYLFGRHRFSQFKHEIINPFSWNTASPVPVVYIQCIYWKCLQMNIKCHFAFRHFPRKIYQY